MNRVCIAVVTACLVSSHLSAQSGNVRGGGRITGRSRQVGARGNFSRSNFGGSPFQNFGGVGLYPPYYDYYDSYYPDFDLYRLSDFYNFWTSINRRDAPQQPMYADRSPEPPPPPPPPPSPAPVVRQYNWPEQISPPTPFSIVTTSGTVYLATMVWVEGGNVLFNSVDGGVLRIPLSSVSRSLTQTANAQKNLNLRLP
jgi:hypothetical protein